MIIHFWQNILSPHQSAYLRALAEMGHEVHLIVEQPTLPERDAMGWDHPDFGHTRITVAPDEATIAAILDDGAVRGAYHVVSGPRGTRLALPVLRQCRARRLPVGLLCEAGDHRGVPGILRRVLYARDALIWRRTVDFVLAMGQLGVDWYRQVGYRHDRIFPFAYSVETPPSCSSPPPGDGVVQLTYVGSLIPLKGLDLLLKALAPLAHLPWALDIIGDGPVRSALQRLAARQGIAERLTLHGTLPMSGIAPQLARTDLLVLPSRYDGWGAVINEALLCGTPALCSTRCGAADLLCAPCLGGTFQVGHVASLRRALAARITRGPLASGEREQIRQWARCLKGESLADYLLEILRHVYTAGPLPMTPWQASPAAAILSGEEGRL